MNRTADPVLVQEAWAKNQNDFRVRCQAQSHNLLSYESNPGMYDKFAVKSDGLIP